MLLYITFFCFILVSLFIFFFFFFQAEDGIRDKLVTGVQTCALPIYSADLGAPQRRGYLLGLLDRGLVEDQRQLDDDDVGAGVRAGEVAGAGERSEERRVGKECRCRGAADHEKKNREGGVEMDRVCG